QRGASGAHGARDDLGNFELRVDLCLDAHELSFALEERDPLAKVVDRHVSVRTQPALALAPPLADSMRPFAEEDHGDEEQSDEQHDEDHMLPVGDRVEDHSASTLAKCIASARSTSDASGLPPSEHAASTQASPSPRSPVAQSAAHREISSAIAATASTPPASAIRTRPWACR